MTGLGKWQAGGELQCPACPLSTSDHNGEPACQIALELACVGETMSASCCPEPVEVAA